MRYSYIISSGASFIGAFDITYSITGSVSSMGASKDLIISTITEDFGNSPTIGYVNNTSSPFVKVAPGLRCISEYILRPSPLTK